jgi:hypothetical protein
MHDLNPLERRLFDWLSRRSDFVLAILPIAVFLGLGILGIVAVSAIAGRSPDYYVVWVITLSTIAATGLYVTATRSCRLTTSGIVNVEYENGRGPGI